MQAGAVRVDKARLDYQVVETLRGRLPDHVALDGAIALGGSLTAYDPRLLETRRWIRNGVLSGQPFLGICLGGQLLASALGAVVARGRPEAGLHDVFLTDAADHDPRFELTRRPQVFSWHQDSFALAQGAVPPAGSIACTYQAFRFGAAAYGLPFHPEIGAEHVARWREVSGYNGLAERTGTDFDTLMIDLRRATPRLGALAGQLLQRWLHLVSGVAALASRREAAA